jgi:type IV fimbrial biogenesis protein FimT
MSSIGSTTWGGRNTAGSRRRANRGVTLLEMVSVMGIVAILMAVAVPSYKYVSTSNRIAAEINGLVGDLQYARAEAIKEGQFISVCAVSSAAPTTCAGAAATPSWSGGWMVFTDADGSGTLGGTDAPIRTQSAFTGTDTLIANNALSVITFNREGFAVNMAAGSLLTLHATPAVTASTRCLSVEMIGLLTTQKSGAGTCL